MSDHHAIAQWLHAQGVKQLSADSRLIQPGSAFIAWPGYAKDARMYVESALNAGACAVLVEADGLTDSCLSAALQNDPRVTAISDLKAQAGRIAHAFYGHPSEALTVLAVTGTNGKTSVSWWLASAYRALGMRCGLVGTLGMGEVDALKDTGLTTPDPVQLQAGLRAMADEGVVACALEASSIGIVESRLNGLQIHTAIWTNLTQDHLDYHGDMARYAAAKAQLFDWPDLAVAVLNVDDGHGAALAKQLEHRVDLDLWTVSVQAHVASPTQPSRLTACGVTATEAGTRFTLFEDGEGVVVDTPVVGHFNVSNLLCVAAALRAQAVSLAAIAQAFRSIDGVPGRLERIPSSASDLAVFVDYAHTPDAIEKALDALQPMAEARGGRLWCLLGCGGNRDKTKRGPMAVAAYQGSDAVVVTSDNPRDEQPSDIIDDMLAGLRAAGLSQKLVLTVVDRDAAIATVVAKADQRDVILLAGKGHETYQEVAGVRRPFSDVAVARAALAQRSNAAPMAHPVECLHEVEGVQMRGDWRRIIPQSMRIHSDTRSLKPGDFFVALSGERFDANDFLPELRSQGVEMALATRDLVVNGLVGAEVLDTRKALGEWSKIWRHKRHLPLIAVTGSNGKTTVTQMLASITRAAFGDDALATQGNFNNDIGVPLTLLRLRPNHRSAVVELGMNHPGEIAYLAAMAQPTVALVNNAQREHLEFMQTVAAVAEENGTVFEALPVDGIAVYPYADTYSAQWEKQASGRRVWTFSTTDAAATVFVNGVWDRTGWVLELHTPMGEATCRLALAGQHNVANAAAATACALAAGCPLTAVIQGLSDFKAVKGRSRTNTLIRNGAPLALIDDTYNANPDSMHAAIEVLATLPKPRWLVMGDMGEVGTQGAAFHEEALQHAKRHGIERIDVAGQWWSGVVQTDPAARAADTSESPTLQWHENVDQLAADAPEIAVGFQSVLVKGSRFMRMERVVDALEKTWPAVDAVTASKQEKEETPHAA